MYCQRIILNVVSDQPLSRQYIQSRLPDAEIEQMAVVKMKDPGTDWIRRTVFMPYETRSLENQNEPGIYVLLPEGTAQDDIVTGKRLSPAEVKQLKAAGVVETMYVEMSSADGMSTSFYTTRIGAEVFLSELGFAIPTDGLEIITRNRGDDGGDELWLTLAVPAALVADLEETNASINLTHDSVPG